MWLIRVGAANPKCFSLSPSTLKSQKMQHSSISNFGPAPSSSNKYYAYLGDKDYRQLIYSGDHYTAIPFLGTQAWIRSLNYSIVDYWRPWRVEGPIAGYTRIYSNQMTLVTPKGEERGTLLQNIGLSYVLPR